MRIIHPKLHQINPVFSRTITHSPILNLKQRKKLQAFLCSHHCVKLVYQQMVKQWRLIGKRAITSPCHLKRNALLPKCFPISEIHRIITIKFVLFFLPVERHNFTLHDFFYKKPPFISNGTRFDINLLSNLVLENLTVK